MFREDFVNDPVDIVGNKSGKGAPSASSIEVDDAMMRTYRGVQGELRTSGRSTLAQWNGVTVVAPSDGRMLFRFTPDRNNHPKFGVPVMDADGVDMVTITIEKMTNLTTVDTTFNATRIFLLENGDAWRVTFVDGVTSKEVRMTKSGLVDLIRQNNQYRVNEPLSLLAVN